MTDVADPRTSPAPAQGSAQGHANGKDDGAAKPFNPEAFALNMARAMESSGKALAAYLQPRQTGETVDKPPNELTEIIKTFSTVANYWLSDEKRSTELQMKLGKAYLDLWGNAMRRMTGEPFWRSHTDSMTIEATARNSLCQFCMDSNQKRELQRQSQADMCWPISSE